MSRAYTIYDGKVDRSGFRHVYEVSFNGAVYAWDLTDYLPGGRRSMIVRCRVNSAVYVPDWSKLPQASRVDYKHAATICLRKAFPVLKVVRDIPGVGVVEFIADGNHRLAKAALDKMRVLPACKLTLEESDAAFLPSRSRNILENSLHAE